MSSNKEPKFSKEIESINQEISGISTMLFFR